MSMLEQLKMFGHGGMSEGLPESILKYYPDVFTAEESIELLEIFVKTIKWEQRVVTMYGRKIATPRLTAWYGDDGKNYAYSGNRFNPIPWTKELLYVKRRIEMKSQATFNSVLLNYYRDGNDSVSWHSDNETELGAQPVIASISFGEVRKFDIRSKNGHHQKFSIRLESGSLLLMKGDLQQNWEHRIAKSPILMNARINLTFRTIH